MEARSLLEHFADVIISHISRNFNEATNDLAQYATEYKLMPPEVNTIGKDNMLTISHQPIEDKS